MKQLNITESLYEYMLSVQQPEHPILAKLREKTAELPLAIMQIPKEQGLFLQLLITIINAKKILEIGTFTGYSALAMALALPEDGQIITLDISNEWTKIAREFWDKAQQTNKINLKLGKAIHSIYALINDGFLESFDLIFIDADKTSYMEYYECALKLLRPRGIIVIDNVLWEGKIIENNGLNATDSQTRALQKLNQFIKNDVRVQACLIPMADGITLVTKK